MQKKYFYSFIIVLIFLPIISFLIYVKSTATRAVETYIKGFPKKSFDEKISKPAPKWMDDQISADLKDFKKITILSIDKTFNHLIQTSPLQTKAFVRYRIIDNKLYRYFPDGIPLNKRELSIEKAIKTLTKLMKLPDMDLITSDMDGTPECYMDPNFNVLDNIADQAPLFTRAKNDKAKFAVLIPDYYSVNISWQEDANKIKEYINKYPWDSKAPLAFWRGGSHDKVYDFKNYKKKPRVVICLLSREYPELVEAGINITDAMQLKDVLINDDLVKPHASLEEHFKYKYLPVIDGYMCTYPGYQWRLLSNSVCFKQESDEIQWFYSALTPYEHYVPIKNDMSDLVEKVKWAKDNDEACKNISKNAQDFVLNNLMLDDVYLYLYKLLTSYSKHLDINKKELIKSTKSDSHWICIQHRRDANKKILFRKEIEDKCR